MRDCAGYCGKPYYCLRYGTARGVKVVVFFFFFESGHAAAGEGQSRQKWMSKTVGKKWKRDERKIRNIDLNVQYLV